MIRRLLPRLLGCCALAILAGLAIPALSRPPEEKDKPLGDLPADLKLVPRDAIWFASVRVADLAGSATGKLLFATIPAEEFGPGLPPAKVERVTFAARRSSQPPVVIVRALKPFDADALRKGMGTEKEAKAHGVTFHHEGKEGGRAVWVADARTYVTAPPAALVPYLAAMKKAGKTHPLADELATAAGKHSATLAALPSLIARVGAAEDARHDGWGRPRRDWGKDDGPPRKERFEKESGFKDDGRKEGFDKDDGRKDGFEKEPPPRKAIDIERLAEPKLELLDLDDALDRGMRHGPDSKLFVRPLIRCRAALLTLDIGEEITLSARASFADAEGAKDAAALARLGLLIYRDSLPTIFKHGRVGPAVKGVKEMQDAMRAVEIKQDGKTLTADAKSPLATAALVKIAITNAAIAREQNNLKQIGLAFHNYHDTFSAFPAQGVSHFPVRGGKLSWRVAILPYIEQEALYKQFRFDEDWDSPHNKKLIPLMPKIYAAPARKTAEPGQTFYQVFTGPGTMYEKPDVMLRIVEFTDGTSNTILVAEAAKAVIWTKPEDIKFPAKGVPRLGGQFEGFFNVLMADGSVRRLNNTISEKTLRAAITHNANDELGKDW